MDIDGITVMAIREVFYNCVLSVGILEKDSINVAYQ